MRISDIIVYIGKDRQDAQKAKMAINYEDFTSGKIRVQNAKMINNLIVDIIENSYRQDHLRLSNDVFEELRCDKRENYQLIYKNEGINNAYEKQIRPMFHDLYQGIIDDYNQHGKNSILQRHYLDYITENYGRATYIETTDTKRLVLDFIASMTDNYFLELYKHLFPNGKHKITYHSYFTDF